MKRECKWCGDEFEAKRADHNFCSPECRGKHGNVFRKFETSGPDFWAVTTPYGSHVFDGLVASWLRSAPISGSTFCGV